MAKFPSEVRINNIEKDVAKLLKDSSPLDLSRFNDKPDVLSEAKEILNTDSEEILAAKKFFEERKGS